mmetsp:Transcript_33728/g.54313  ORF Transcript_33728/g.54313 Transcript_33728/m.54313 type:complete len:97 (+) Transcript_33728:624-914(+)
MFPRGSMPRWTCLILLFELSDTEWKEELDQVNAKSTEPIDYTKKYCVCNDTYQDGDFMIACDVCNDWFHGECIGITEEKGESMESFVCNLCRGFNF